MATFGESLLQGFLGAQGVRDYSHAAWTFWSNAAELMPRYKFLFHVYFNINTGEIPALQKTFGTNDQYTVGMMVKTIQTPGIDYSVETMNQYNRKRLIQTNLKYKPVQIMFHDDQGDLVRSMLYNYYAYYYKDPSQKYNSIPVQNGSLGQIGTLANGYGYNARNTYTPSWQNSDWGYIGESYQDSSPVTGTTPGKPAFFKDIRIYGLSQKKFASWVMINPLITSWTGDTYDYYDGSGTMSQTIDIEYESLKFYTGAIGGATPSGTVPGFADPGHYDNLVSPISRPGSRNSVFGQGGLLDAGAGIIEDLQNLSSGSGGITNLLGAVQIGASAWYNIFRNQNIGTTLQNEINQALPGIIQQGIPNAARLVMNTNNSMFYPLSAFPGNNYFINNRGS